MRMKTYRLSVDEIAMALSQMDEADLARSLLAASAAGELTAEQASGRLLAAGHSLIARSMLDVDLNGLVHLSPELETVVRPLAHADFAVRLSRSDGGPESVRSFLFAGEEVIEHDVESDIVYELTRHASLETVLSASVGFLSAEEAMPFEADGVTISGAVLDDMQETASAETMHEMLAAEGMPEATRALFVPDFQNVVSRGSILKVTFDNPPELASDVGTLVLRGPRRLWLLRMMPGDDMVHLAVTPGTAETLRAELVRLINGTSEVAIQ